MICTWYRKDELDKMKTVTDSRLNDLFQEVRAKFGGRYYMQEITRTTKTIFGKPKSFVYYSLYGSQGDGEMQEVQCINFAQDKGGSINTTVTASYIITYFLGLLGGLNYSVTVKS
jgi:hypothetical protein